MKKVFIAGCGYIGHRVAKLEQEKGAEVTALVRSCGSAERLEASGFGTVRGDLDAPDSLSGLSVAGSLIYYFAPPPPAGKFDPRIEAFLAALSPAGLPDRILLISTTGLYGDCGGEWVTEERPPNPNADRAYRRFDAEKALLRFSSDHNVDVVILRVPGIYGPGRLPEKRLREGKPVLREEDSPFSNRVHADDLARVCIAASTRGRAGEVYNVSDGHPSTMTDYFFLVADLLGIPRPPAISLEEAKRGFSEEILSYLTESRRIDNSKMLEELEMELVYPDLERGLAACL